jgi:nucleoside-diphosphate-sugar epimerase
MPKISLRIEVVVRVCADLVILNAALFGGLVSNRSFIALVGRPTAMILTPYLHSFWALSMIGLATFALMGFYTRGRAYASRYKVLVVLQAAALTYVLFGFAGYVVPFVGRVSRPSLLLAWGITSIGLVCARLWATIWRHVTMADSFNEPPHVGPAIVGTRGAILLIGGGGYIGSGLLPRLLKSGYHVRLLDAFLYGREPIEEWANHPKLQIVEADFRRVDRIVEAMHGIDTVIHLGAIVGDPACALDEELTIETNLLATRMIAEVTKGHGIKRFIFASTCSVYGASDLYLDERSRLNPVSLYARSKIACENVLLDMKCDSFQPVILRFGTIYGLSGRTRFDLVVNLLSAKAIVDGVITVFGSDQWRPFLHVNDAALAVYLACRVTDQALADTIFNVGSDRQNYTLGEVGRIIHSMVPSADLQFFEKDVDRRNYRVDFHRIQHCLRFEPEWSLEMGINQVLEALRSGKVVDYKDPRYSNVRFLSEEIGPQSLRFEQQRWVEDAMHFSSHVEMGAGD